MTLRDGGDLMSRYARHAALDGFGTEGQERVMASRVLIVGAGGLGSPVALYLAAAGVGRIGIADDDCVSVSNLQRQVIHTTADVGRPKVESAAEKMAAINPALNVVPMRLRLDASNAEAIVSEYDFVVVATDNLASKFLVNDVCVALGKPFSFGGVNGYCGQAMTHLPGTATLRSVFGGEPAAGETAPMGVFGPLVGIIGTIQATETLKVLSRVGEPFVNRLIVVDARTLRFSEFDVRPDAPACQ